MSRPRRRRPSTRGLLLQIYETVARIRAFDDKAQTLIKKAEAFFTHYPVRGHEIISGAVAPHSGPTTT